MLNELPADRQSVEVRFNDDDWQPAVFRGGQFLDIYGLPLNQDMIAGWRAAERELPASPRRHGGWTQP